MKISVNISLQNFFLKILTLPANREYSGDIPVSFHEFSEYPQPSDTVHWTLWNQIKIKYFMPKMIHRKKKLRTDKKYKKQWYYTNLQIVKKKGM